MSRLAVVFSFLLALSSVASAVTLGDVEAEWREGDPRGSRAILERMDPNSPAALRLLDLVFRQFRERRQFYLLTTWSAEIEAASPLSALGIQALAWRSWMVPKEDRSEADAELLRKRIAETDYGTTWLELASALPDDLSGVLALRLAEVREETSHEFSVTWERIAKRYPRTGLSSYASLREGNLMAENGEWDRAVDRWLSGLDGYPVPWEEPEWRGRIGRGLRLTGKSVQVRLVEGGTRADLSALLRFRRAVADQRDGRFSEALKSLSELRGWFEDSEKDSVSPEFGDLIEAHLDRVRGMLGEMTVHEDLLKPMMSARGEGLDRLLAAASVRSETGLGLISGLYGVAQVRLDNGQTNEAAAILAVVAARGQRTRDVAANAYRLLLRIYRERLDLLAGVLNALPRTAREEELLRFDEGRRLDEATQPLRTLLAQAEVFAASHGYSESTFRLVKSIYELNAELGSPGAPKDLFLEYAADCGQEDRELIVAAARVLRPEEAVAILHLASGSQEAVVEKHGEELLSICEQQERFADAARIARALAEEASGTDRAEEAWQRVARLEYKSGDYRTAADTLTRLLEVQDPESEEGANSVRLLALAQFRRGKYKETRDLVDSIVERDQFHRGQREELRMMKAYTFLYSQEYEDAIRELEQILADNPTRATQREASSLIERLQ